MARCQYPSHAYSLQGSFCWLLPSLAGNARTSKSNIVHRQVYNLHYIHGKKERPTVRKCTGSVKGLAAGAKDCAGPEMRQNLLVLYKCFPCEPHFFSVSGYSCSSRLASVTTMGDVHEMIKNS